MVLDAKSGEVLALANWPSYNPNNREKPALAVMRNHAVTDQFEPGSTMKPFTVATALENGMVRPETVINTRRRRLHRGRTNHTRHAPGQLADGRADYPEVQQYGRSQTGAVLPAQNCSGKV